MKTSPLLSKFGFVLVIIVLITLSQRVFAQGTFLFSNLAEGVDAPIRFIHYPYDGSSTLLAGSEWTAEVYLSSDLENNPLGTQFFSSDPAFAGYFFGPVIEIPGTNPGDTVSLTVSAFYTDRVYETEVGDIEPLGHAIPFDVQLGGGNLPPANLVNLQSFNLVTIPEPSTWALCIAGGVIVVLKLGPVSGRKKWK